MAGREGEVDGDSLARDHHSPARGALHPVCQEERLNFQRDHSCPGELTPRCSCQQGPLELRGIRARAKEDDPSPSRPPLPTPGPTFYYSLVDP